MQYKNIINEQEKATLSFLSVLHAFAKVKLDKSQPTLKHTPFCTPTRTPLGLGPNTRNFLRVFGTGFGNLKVLQISSKICEQDLCRLHKNLACMLPEYFKRLFVLILEQTRIKMPKESFSKNQYVISFRQRDTNLYLIVQIGSWAQRWENGSRNILQRVRFESSKVRSCCFP